MVRARRGPTLARSMLAACSMKPTAARGEACQCMTLSDTGSTASCAGQRLAHDVGEEARRRLVGLARPHADGGQADADAVDEALAAVVGDQQLADVLLRAVGGERRVEELVADGVGERRAEHGNGAGKHQPRLVAGLAHRLQQAARAVHVDAVALVEVLLGLARDDRREMEDRIRAGRRAACRPRPPPADRRWRCSTGILAPAGPRRARRRRA